ncbi:uncharacterized protein LOC125073002 isoform X3 [Vanessa atalanta]|uniref:uncharacterized protein LOC125073002 isoform X3 n=1 Tax=Vanessa atalanta TaxID=42275 RepID=UPI001FCD70A5|nr:uncharacterized protein LOC125073002 isoform X3 [Vanessa atalanta]
MSEESQNGGSKKSPSLAALNEAGLQGEECGAQVDASTYTSHTNIAQVTASSAPTDSSNKWKCDMCTYENFPLSRKCTMCRSLKPSLGEDIFKLQDGASALPVQDICGADAIAERLKPLRISSPQGQAGASSVAKWSCATCTYENWPRALKCAMCGATTTHSTGINDICNSQNAAPHDSESGGRRSKRRNTDWVWLQACLGVVEGDARCVQAYLAAGGDPARALTAHEVALLDRASAFDAGHTLVHLAIRARPRYCDPTSHRQLYPSQERQLSVPVHQRVLHILSAGGDRGAAGRHPGAAVLGAAGPRRAAHAGGAAAHQLEPAPHRDAGLAPVRAVEPLGRRLPARRRVPGRLRRVRPRQRAARRAGRLAAPRAARLLRALDGLGAPAGGAAALPARGGAAARRVGAPRGRRRAPRHGAAPAARVRAGARDAAADLRVRGRRGQLVPRGGARIRAVSGYLPAAAVGAGVLLQVAAVPGLHARTLLRPGARGALLAATRLHLPGAARRQRGDHVPAPDRLRRKTTTRTFPHLRRGVGGGGAGAALGARARQRRRAGGRADAARAPAAAGADAGGVAQPLPPPRVSAARALGCRQQTPTPTPTTSSGGSVSGL